MAAVAIIPARGGSKRIPRKNIRPFLGRPIITYSIAAALESGIFEEIMVSTNDDEIAEIARGLGASVPFLRSAATSDDHSTTAEVINEVLLAYSEQGRHFDHGCCIYPTAPFVSAQRLTTAYTRLCETGAACLIPVTRFGFPIWRAFRKDGDRIEFIWPDNALRRSQDLEPSFHDAGQFYFFAVPAFLADPSLVGPDTIGIEVPETEVQDIDNESDWRLAELKYRALYEDIDQ